MGCYEATESGQELGKGHGMGVLEVRGLGVLWLSLRGPVGWAGLRWGGFQAATELE